MNQGVLFMRQIRTLVQVALALGLALGLALTTQIAHANHDDQPRISNTRGKSPFYLTRTFRDHQLATGVNKREVRRQVTEFIRMSMFLHKNSTATCSDVDSALTCTSPNGRAKSFPSLNANLVNPYWNTRVLTAEEIAAQQAAATATADAYISGNASSTITSTDITQTVFDDSSRAPASTVTSTDVSVSPTTGVR